MPGEANEAVQTEQQHQDLWDEVSRERENEAGALSPSDETLQETLKTGAEEGALAGEDQGGPGGSRAAAEPREAPVVDDPYAGLSPAVRERLEKLDKLESLTHTLTQSVKTAEGRVAAMQRELDVSRNAAKAVTEAPTSTQIAAASASPEKWKALKETFPEWADATESLLDARLAGLTSQQTAGLTAEQVRELVAGETTKVRDEARAAIQEAKVEGKYPDWMTTINSDPFVGWWQKQAPDVQKLAHSPDGKDAIRMLDLYHESLAKPAEVVAEKRTNRLQAAVSTPKQGNPASTARSVENMTDDELWEHERRQSSKRAAATGLVY